MVINIDLGLISVLAAVAVSWGQHTMELRWLRGEMSALKEELKELQKKVYMNGLSEKLEGLRCALEALPCNTRTHKGGCSLDK